MAMMMSSATTSMVPLAMKYMDSMMSPGWTKVSPGGQWVDLNFTERARKHPSKVRKGSIIKFIGDDDDDYEGGNGDQD